MICENTPQYSNYHLDLRRKKRSDSLRVSQLSSSYIADKKYYFSSYKVNHIFTFFYMTDTYAGKISNQIQDIILNELRQHFVNTKYYFCNIFQNRNNSIIILKQFNK